MKKRIKNFVFLALTLFCAFLIIELSLGFLDIGFPKKLENYNLSAEFDSPLIQSESFFVRRNFSINNQIDVPPGFQLIITRKGDEFEINFKAGFRLNEFKNNFLYLYCTKTGEGEFIVKKNIEFPVGIKLSQGIRFNILEEDVGGNRLWVSFKIPKYFDSKELEELLDSGVILSSEDFNILGDQKFFVYDPKTGYRLRPHASYRPGEKAAVSKLNSQGFRDDEFFSTAKYKILILGDSTSFGTGVGFTKYIYPSLLEKEINRFLKSKNPGKITEVYNGGIPSYSIYQGLRIYLEVFQHMSNWDFLIVMLGWNPPALISGMNFIGWNPVESKNLDKVRGYLRNTRIYNMLRTHIQNLPWIQNRSQSLHEKLLEVLVQKAQKNGTEVVLLPLLIRPNTFSDNYLEKRIRINKSMEQVANKYGVIYLENVSKAFLEEENKIDWIDNVHFGPVGHEIVSDQLFNLLKTKLKVFESHP